MPKNKGAGGSKFKQNKSNNFSSSSQRETPFTIESDEFYGMVIKTLGNSRFMVHVFDKNVQVLCTLKKSIRRKMHIEPGTIVFLIVRSYQQDHGDIVYPYDYDEVQYLKENGKISEEIIQKVNEKMHGGNSNKSFKIEDLSDDSISESELNIDEI